MKAFIISAIIFLTTLIPAFAVIRCIDLNSTKTCSGQSTSGAEWGATCGQTEVKGTFFCASTSGHYHELSDTIRAEQTSNNNKYCWCKMYYPAISKWILIDENEVTGDGGGCLYSCAGRCAKAMATDSDFRTKILGNLS